MPCVAGTRAKLVTQYARSRSSLNFEIEIINREERTKRGRLSIKVIYEDHVFLSINISNWMPLYLVQ